MDCRVWNHGHVATYPGGNPPVMGVPILARKTEELSSAAEPEDADHGPGPPIMDRDRDRDRRPLRPCAHYLWVDLECTGLDVNRDEIMEVAAVITTTGRALHEMARFHAIVRPSDPTLFDTMDPWCQAAHRAPRQSCDGQSLVDLCLKSTTTIGEVDTALAAFVDLFRDDTMAPMVLCGSSIKLDYDFLTRFAPSVAKRLHYRLGDVSAIFTFAKPWYPGLMGQIPRRAKLAEPHSAMDDIIASIDLMRWFGRTLFVHSV